MTLSGFGAAIMYCEKQLIHIYFPVKIFLPNVGPSDTYYLLMTWNKSLKFVFRLGQKSLEQKCL